MCALCDSQYAKTSLKIKCPLNESLLILRFYLLIWLFCTLFWIEFWAKVCSIGCLEIQSYNNPPASVFHWVGWLLWSNTLGWVLSPCDPPVSEYVPDWCFLLLTIHMLTKSPKNILRVLSEKYVVKIVKYISDIKSKVKSSVSQPQCRLLWRLRQ